jgi:hypothetical protein
MTGIGFPVPISKIEKFEKQNKISINVFEYEEGKVFPLHLAKLCNGHKEVNLLYLSDENGSILFCFSNFSIFEMGTGNPMPVMLSSFSYGL